MLSLFGHCSQHPFHFLLPIWFFCHPIGGYTATFHCCHCHCVLFTPPTSLLDLIQLSWILQLESGEGNGTPLQYSRLENPMDGGAWWTTVHGVTKNRTRLSDFTFTFHFHALEKEMATHSSVLAWRIPGKGGGLLGCRLWGCPKSDMTEVT